jgi:hypothetical protein
MISIKIKSLKNIKCILSIKTLLVLAGLTLFIITCTRDEETEKERKETMTIALNAEISADTLKGISKNPIVNIIH